MRRDIIAAIAALGLATACGSSEEAETPAPTVETPEPEAAPGEATPTPEEPPAEAAPAEAAPGERVDATMGENHLPTQLGDAVTAPTGEAARAGLIEVTMVDGTSLTRDHDNPEGEHYAVEGAAAPTAALTRFVRINRLSGATLRRAPRYSPLEAASRSAASAPAVGCL